MWREHRPVKGTGDERASTDQNHTETGWGHTEPCDTQSQPHVGDRAGHKQKPNTSPFLSPFTTDVEGFSWFSAHPGISCDTTLLSLPPTSAEVLCRSWCSSVLKLFWAGHASSALVEVQPLSFLRKLFIPSPSAGSGWAPAPLWLSAAAHCPGAGGDAAGAASNTSCSSCCLETCTGKHSAGTWMVLTTWKPVCQCTLSFGCENTANAIGRRAESREQSHTSFSQNVVFGLTSSWLMTSHGPTPQGQKSQGTADAPGTALGSHFVTCHPLPQHRVNYSNFSLITETLTVWLERFRQTWLHWKLTHHSASPEKAGSDGGVQPLAAPAWPAHLGADPAANISSAGCSKTSVLCMASVICYKNLTDCCEFWADRILPAWHKAVTAAQLTTLSLWAEQCPSLWRLRWISQVSQWAQIQQNTTTQTLLSHWDGAGQGVKNHQFNYRWMVSKHPALQHPPSASTAAQTASHIFSFTSATPTKTQCPSPGSWFPFYNSHFLFTSLLLKQQWSRAVGNLQLPHK